MHNEIIEYLKHPEWPQTLPRHATKWLGINQRRLLQFCLKYPNQWHGFQQDAVTVRTVKSLAHKVDNLEIAWETQQFFYHKEK